VDGFLRTIRAKHPELDSNGPRFRVHAGLQGQPFQDGWAKTVDHPRSSRSSIQSKTEPALSLVDCTSRQIRGRATPSPSVRHPGKVNVLHGLPPPGRHRRIALNIFEDFGLDPVFLPDLSGSLDGHIPDDFTPTTSRGIGLEDIRDAGVGRPWTVAIGEQMRPCALALEEKTGVALRPVRPAHGPGALRRADVLPVGCFRADFPCRSNTVASAASWWTPCWTAISSSGARKWPSGPSRISSGASGELLRRDGLHPFGRGHHHRILPSGGPSHRGSPDRRPGRPGAARRGLRPAGHPLPRTPGRRAPGDPLLPRRPSHLRPARAPGIWSPWDTAAPAT
jgi:hypothetical protein